MKCKLFRIGLSKFHTGIEADQKKSKLLAAEYGNTSMASVSDVNSYEKFCEHFQLPKTLSNSN